jgi:hypothetical protein
MKKILSKFLIITLMIGAVVPCVVAQSADRNVKSQSVGKTTEAPVKTNSIPDELIALLPASNLVAVLDAKRGLKDLLPRLSELKFGGMDKLASQVQEFLTNTGIDTSKVKNAVMGFQMNGMQFIGAVIFQGLALDDKNVEAAMKAAKFEYKTENYKGKQLYLVTSIIKPPSLGPFSIKSNQLALITLGQERVVIGDLQIVKSIADVQTGAAKGGVTNLMTAALKETKETALVRFALDIPQDLRTDAANQGDLFKSIAAIKIMMGTIDFAEDLSLSLDTNMRTESPKQAIELEQGLKGLLSLARAFLPPPTQQNDIYGQIIDQVKIGTKLSDVSLSIILSRPIMDQLSK